MGSLQAMLSGEVPIIQLGGTASMLANFAGADTVIVATILKKFLFSIFSRPEITRIADLKGKLFGATRFGTLSDFASRFALEKSGLNPERDITMVQTGGQPETVLALLTGKVQAAALSRAGDHAGQEEQHARAAGHGETGVRDSPKRRRDDAKISKDQRGHGAPVSPGLYRGACGRPRP